MRQGSAIYRADEAANPLGQQIANCEPRTSNFEFCCYNDLLINQHICHSDIFKDSFKKLEILSLQFFDKVDELPCTD